MQKRDDAQAGEYLELARREILSLSPYVPGKSIAEVKAEYGLKEVHKLASNENPLGPSPQAVVAMEGVLQDLHRYPRGDCPEVREELAEHWQLEEENLTFGNGTDNVIVNLVGAVLNPGERAVIPEPTFPIYASEVRRHGGEVRPVPLKSFCPDPADLLQAVDEKTKLLFICSPNNPTGTILGHEQLTGLLDSLPDQVITVLDEAYGEYVDDSTYPCSAELVSAGYRLLALRTFSKAYGLAGIRIGYGLAPAGLIDLIERVREPFAVNRVAQAAGLAALRDRRHLQRVLEVNRQGREYLTEKLAELGLKVVPSQANFILFNVGQPADEICEKMLQAGVIVRPGSVWGLPQWIRVTVDTPEVNRYFIDVLQSVLSC